MSIIRTQTSPTTFEIDQSKVLTDRNLQQPVVIVEGEPSSDYPQPVGISKMLLGTRFADRSSGIRRLEIHPYRVVVDFYGNLPTSSVRSVMDALETWLLDPHPDKVTVCRGKDDLSATLEADFVINPGNSVVVLLGRRSEFSSEHLGFVDAILAEASACGSIDQLEIHEFGVTASSRIPGRAHFFLSELELRLHDWHADPELAKLAVAGL